MNLRKIAAIKAVILQSSHFDNLGMKNLGLLILIGLLLSDFLRAEEPEAHHLTFEQRTAVNALKFLGGNCSPRRRFGKNPDERLTQITYPAGFSDDQLKLLEPLLTQPLKSIALRRHSLSPDKVRLLGKSYPELVTLRLHDHEVTPETMQVVGEFPKLDWLDIRGCKVPTAPLAVKGAYPKLNRIRLDNVAWQAADYENLRQLRNLNSLMITEGKLDEAAIIAISKLPQLTMLALDHVEVESVGFKALTQHPTLSEFSMTMSPIQPPDLAHFRNASYTTFNIKLENFKTIDDYAPFFTMQNLNWLIISSDEELDPEVVIELERRINEPRLRANLKKGHVAGYPITSEQVEKLKLQEPVSISTAKYQTGDPDRTPKNHWYPPAWLEEEWKKQKDDPASDKINEWFPSPEENLIDLVQ